MPKITWLDEDKLREEIRKIKPRDWLFDLLKAELSTLGYWRRKKENKIRMSNKRNLGTPKT